MIDQANLNYFTKVLDIFYGGIVGTITNTSQIELILCDERMVDFRNFDIGNLVLPFQEFCGVLE